MKIQKAIEISDAKIHFVSLVDKAANKRQFLITKAEDGKAQFSTVGKIIKTDDNTHYITGIVYEPLVEDSHGNYMTEEEIRKAAYWFAENGDKVDIQHSFEKAAGVTVVESYVTLCDMEIEGQTIAKGTWLMTAKVDNADVWEKVQKGEVTGFSMGGVGIYSEVDTEIPDAVEKAGVLKKLAKFLGIETIEKGAVKDRFTESSMNSNFWNALNALKETLRKWVWSEELQEWRYRYETDKQIIREALSEFAEIITDVLAMTDITKAITENAPVTKAGNKEKEEIQVTKQEIQATIEESIKKALAQSMEEVAKSAEPLKLDEPLTAESVQKMIETAIKKATEPEAEPEQPITVESVQKMIETAVTATVAPLLKARGVPSSLDGVQPVEKSEEPHYMAGMY